MHRKAALALVVAAAALAACSTTRIRKVDPRPLVLEKPESLPEDQLLDVGIGLFDPGIDDAGKSDLTSPEIRRAEARYLPQLLVDTLQETGNWGVVRVIPDRQSEMDVWVDGAILQSDGEMLKLRVTVQDSTGEVWFTRTYQEEASKFAYDPDLRKDMDPFQGLYNQIANDMLAYRKNLQPAAVKKIRTVSELRFLRRFSPDEASHYLSVDGGHYEIERLPAENDPLLERVRRIRQRDDLFVDTLQDYYSAFARQMKTPYLEWRRDTYEEGVKLRRDRAAADARIIGGGAAVALGLAAIAGAIVTGVPAVQTVGPMAGIVGLGTGSMLIKSGLGKSAEAKMHVEALHELSSSLDKAIKPHTMTLEERTVTLTGTVEQQYAQWREILKKIYQTETGTLVDQP